MGWWVLLSFTVFVAGTSIGLGSRNGLWAARRSHRPVRQPFSTWFRWLLGATGLAVFLLNLPVLWAENGPGSWALVSTLFGAVYATLQTFTGNADILGVWYLTRDEPLPLRAGGAFSVAISTWAPLAVTSYVLSYLKSFSVMVRYRLPGKSNVHVFSELNERSLALAESIHQRGEQNALVFTGVKHGLDSTPREMVDRAEQLGAICLTRGINDEGVCHAHRKAKLYFYVISTDEEVNLRHAIALSDSPLPKRQQNPELYVISDSPAIALAIRESDNDIRVRLINPKRAMIYNWLWRNATSICQPDETSETSCGLDVFTSAKRAVEGTKTIAAAIIGLGDYGSEMLKALTWYCQMDDETSSYYLTADVYEKDALVTARFEADHPGLFDPARATRPHPDLPRQDASYQITTHPGSDIDNPDVVKQIIGSEPTFVFISLGDDAHNLEFALALRRRLAERASTARILIAWRGAEETRRKLDQQLATEDCPVRIGLIGTANEVFSYDTIIRSEIENNGLICHMYWDICAVQDPDTAQLESSEQVFLTDEYSYASSIAVPIHWKARRGMKTPGADKDAASRTSEEWGRLVRLEHARWAAFLRSEGFRYDATKDVRGAKTHPLLIDFDHLPTEDVSKDDNDSRDVFRKCETRANAITDEEAKEKVKEILEQVREDVVGGSA